MKYLKRYNESSISEELKSRINDILEEVKDYDLVYRVDIHENVYPGYDRIMININKEKPSNIRPMEMNYNWSKFECSDIKTVIDHLVSFLDESGYKENKIGYLSLSGHSNSSRRNHLDKLPPIRNLTLYFGSK
jgi:hypothetical protein